MLEMVYLSEPHREAGLGRFASKGPRYGSDQRYFEGRSGQALERRDGDLQEGRLTAPLIITSRADTLEYGRACLDALDYKRSEALVKEALAQRERRHVLA